MVNVVHLLFRLAESEVSFHLTRAESQAAMMVGVHQGFDIGLFVNPARLMWWSTQLTGRCISICLESPKTTTLHEASSVTCLYSWFPLYPKSDLYLITDGRLVRNLILVPQTSRRTIKVELLNVSRLILQTL